MVVPHARTRFLGLLAGVLLAGCPDPDTPVEAETEDETGAAGVTSSSGGSGSADDTADDTAGSGPAYARGIAISEVDANSGTAIAIAIDGAVVAVDDRSAPLPKNRNTAVRVFVDIDEDIWVQREIEARLTIVAPDGESTELSVNEVIAGDSSANNLQSNFLFGVLAEFIVPGAEYRLELLEVEDASVWQGLPEPALIPAIPLEGTTPLGPSESLQKMRVMLVPVQYTQPDGGACEVSIDTSEENIARYADQLFQHNPVEELDIMVHEPLVVDDIELSNPGPVYLLLARISNLRAEEQPDPDVYYYGLFDNCGACITSDGSGGVGGCLLGVAAGIAEDTIGAAAIRVAVGVDRLGEAETIGPDTFVHELGHNQGRQHVECPGAVSAGPDLAYPHAEGSIGVWGFGVLDFGIRNPSNHKDYMSYCNPTWVSDWQWAATFDRIAELSSWGFGGDGDAPPRGDEVMLVGAVDPTTGAQRWWTDRGEAPSATLPGVSAWTVEYELADGAIVQAVGVVNPWSEGPWVTVRAPLSAALERELARVRVSAPGRSFEVDGAAIVRNRRRD